MPFISYLQKNSQRAWVSIHSTRCCLLHINLSSLRCLDSIPVVFCWRWVMGRTSDDSFVVYCWCYYDWGKFPCPKLWLPPVREVTASAWGAAALAVFVGMECKFCSGSSLPGTTLGYFLNNWAIQNTSPLIIAMYTPAEMVITAILAAIVLGEKLKWQQGKFVISTICCTNIIN